MQIIKKDGTLEQYNEQKIIDACNKAARRAMIELSDKDYSNICNFVWEKGRNRKYYNWNFYIISWDFINFKLH